MTLIFILVALFNHSVKYNKKANKSGVLLMKYCWALLPSSIILCCSSPLPTWPWSLQGYSHSGIVISAFKVKARPLFFLPHLPHPISISFLTFRSCRYSSSSKCRGVLLTDTWGQSAISLLFKESKSFPSLWLLDLLCLWQCLAPTIPIMFQGCVIYHCDLEHVITAIAWNASSVAP